MGQMKVTTNHIMSSIPFGVIGTCTGNVQALNDVSVSQVPAYYTCRSTGCLIVISNKTQDELHALGNSKTLSVFNLPLRTKTFPSSYKWDEFQQNIKTAYPLFWNFIQDLGSLGTVIIEPGMHRMGCE